MLAKTHLLVMEAKIGSHLAQIDPKQAQEAIKPRTVALRHHLELFPDREEDPSDSEVNYLRRCEAMIVERIAECQQKWRQHRVKHVSVFALAPIPLLMILGRELGDKIPATLYNLNRSRQSWTWMDGEPPDLGWSFREYQTRARTQDVALLLSVSGAVDKREAISALKNPDVDCYEIRINNPMLDQIQYPEHVEQFTRHYREALANIRNMHGRDVRIHLFPALPLPLAIECGRRLVQADPHLAVYNISREHSRYEYAIRLWGEKKLEPTDLQPVRTASPPGIKVVLVVASSPTDRDRLRTDQESKRIKLHADRGAQRDEYRIEPLPAASWEDFKDQVLRHRPYLIHFAGHGDGPAGLLFQRDDGDEEPISTETFVNFLRLDAQVQCVVLNACQSAHQAGALKGHIPYVVGMQQSVSDAIALVFADGFYQTLFHRGDVKMAFEVGKANVRQKDPQAAEIIQLFVTEISDLAWQKTV